MDFAAACAATLDLLGASPAQTCATGQAALAARSRAEPGLVRPPAAVLLARDETRAARLVSLASPTV